MTTLRLRGLLVSLGSLALVGCVLLVSPEQFGTSCRFQGQDTQCGACIVDHCQAPLDDCCRDGTCDSTLHAVESCASVHDDACGAVAAAASRFAVAKCITESCGGVCVALHGAAQTSCKEAPLAAGSACSCSFASGAPNDFLCSASAYAATVCCAPEGWPAVGQECACSPIDCTPNADGCFCLTVATAPLQRACAGKICCAEDDTCSCGTKDCFVPVQTQVPSCDLSRVGCKKGQIRVDSCSIRTP